MSYEQEQLSLSSEAFVRAAFDVFVREQFMQVSTVYCP